jgi:hypothetical protein
VSDDIRLDPLPEYARGLLDFGRIAQMLGETFAQIDEDLHAAAMDNALRFVAEGPDAVGHYSVEVVFAPTGEVVGSTRVHWSRLLA